MRFKIIPKIKFILNDSLVYLTIALPMSAPKTVHGSVTKSRIAWAWPRCLFGTISAIAAILRDSISIFTSSIKWGIVHTPTVDFQLQFPSKSSQQWPWGHSVPPMQLRCLQVKCKIQRERILCGRKCRTDRHTWVGIQLLIWCRKLSSSCSML